MFGSLIGRGNVSVVLNTKGCLDGDAVEAKSLGFALDCKSKGGRAIVLVGEKRCLLVLLRNTKM